MLISHFPVIILPHPPPIFVGWLGNNARIPLRAFSFFLFLFFPQLSSLEDIPPSGTVDQKIETM